MPEYADIYALASKRTEKAVTEFLDHFLPERVESADEYEIPQYSDAPSTVYTKASDLISHCCDIPNEVHTVYWRSENQPEHAMVFFLNDGGVIFGLSTPAEDHQRIDLVADDLGRFLNTKEVIVTYEDLPPGSSEDFRSFFQSLPPKPDETARRSRAHRPIKGEQGVAPNA
jgi:hypothetical protein